MSEARTTKSAPLPSHPRRRLLLAGWGVRVAGVIAIASALTPPSLHRLRLLSDALPQVVVGPSTAATAVIGVLLLLVAHSVATGKRRAWRVSVVLLPVLVVLHLLKGLDVEESVVSALAIVPLVRSRAVSTAVADPRGRLRALTLFVRLLLGSFVAGGLLLAADHGHVLGHKSVGSVLGTVLYGLAGVSGQLALVGGRGDTLGDLLAGFGAITVLLPAYLLLRPIPGAQTLTEQDEDRLRCLLTGPHGGRDSLGYFATRRDKSVVWSPSGKAAVTYRSLRGVMLASGDPVGDPEAWPGAIEAFLAEAQHHAWAPAVMGCSEQAGHAWVKAGLNALELGDEAVLDAACFTLQGREMRGVRQAVSRVERSGLTASVCRVRDLTPAQLEELVDRAAAWRGSDVERGFSMALSRVGDPLDEQCVVVLARDADGVLRALLHFVPWGPDGLSLDLMRRDRSAVNGMNEFLIVAAAQAAPGLGVTRISLNFAVFRSALERGGRLGAGPFARGWRGLLLVAGRWYQIDSLAMFNGKFGPVWEPRFVCYRSGADLPRMGLAALEAEAFLVYPRPRQLLRRLVTRRPRLP